MSKAALTQHRIAGSHVALLNGAHADLHCYVAGVGAHAAIARGLGREEHEAGLRAVIDAAKKLDRRYRDVDEIVVNATAIAA